MNWNIRFDRPTIVVGCSLGIVALLTLYWVLHFWLLRLDYVDEIEAIQPRTARLLGITESFDQLATLSNEAGGALRELVYPGDRDSAITAAAMQQNIRELMTGAGLSVSGSQILPARRADGFDRLSLDITAEGNIDALDEAFLRLGVVQPLVFVESVTIKPSRSRGRRQKDSNNVGGDPRKLTARFHLFSLRIMH